MTIGTNTARVSFNCNGVSPVFPVPIQAYLATDFLVLATNVTTGVVTTLVLNSDYTMVASGTLNPTAWTLTTLTSQLASPYATGISLQVILNPVENQQTQYVQGQAFASLAVQTNMDRLTQMTQRLTDQVGRTLRAPDGDVSPILLLPGATQRANRYQAYDVNGNAIVVAALPATTSPAVSYPQLAGEVSPINLQYNYGDLRRYGCDLTGLTDSTTLFQNAATSIGALGGGVVFHPGGTVMVNQAVKLSSNTTLAGVGPASIIQANPTYVGVNGGGGGYAAQTCHMIGNVNFAAVALTDHDITVRDIAFNWGSVVIASGGAHSISFHFVNRVTCYNVSSTNGENVTSFISCLDTQTLFCHGLNCKNAYFDDWGGTGSAHVISCTGRTTSGTTAQGIQFSGQGSYGDTGQARNAVVAFCELYGIQNAGTASAIICNDAGAGSSSGRFKTFGNYVESSDNGWVAQGTIGEAMSIGDTFRACTTGAPILMLAGSSGSPADCRIINPTLIDCSHTGGNVAMIVINGTNNRVSGIKVMSPGGVLYTLIAWIPSTSVNCFASIEKAPNGSGGARTFNQSTSSWMTDRDDLDSFPSPATTIATIASAATIAPTAYLTEITGAVTINTITVPPGCQNGGKLVFITGGTWVTGVAGNIQNVSTPVAGRPLEMTYIPQLGKWFGSY